jgi:anaerobic selenocysteine-containing dehydrogenase
VLFLYRSNPVASAPDPDRVRKALDRIPLVVSFSPFLDESAEYAHIVLPDHTYLERWQDVPAAPTVPYPVWGVVQPMVPPLHDTRATGDVVLDLASRVGGLAASFPWPTMERLVQARGEKLAEIHSGGTFASDFRRGELRELEARGWWIPHGQSPSGFWESVRRAGGWFDPYYDHRNRAAASGRPDGRAALFPEEARRRIAGALPGLAEGFLPVREETAREHGAGLRLMPYRLMTLASGTIPLMPWLLENLGPLGGGAWEPWVEIHPETARDLGLESAREVRVISEHGAFTARLLLFEGAQPGLVNAPYGLHTRIDGWGSIEPTNPLAAVGPLRDPVTGLPDWYGTEVRLEVHSV